MKTLLVATYELGHQPLILAWRRTMLEGEVRFLDLSVEPYDAEKVAWADRIEISTPMHTARVLAEEFVRRAGTGVMYGMYGERWPDEREMVKRVPDRSGLPPLEKYLRKLPGNVLVGYVEASRGCLHVCNHCPLTPVYGGRFFAVPRDVVMADIRQLVAAGAGHITFGDPDFLNGPGHSLKLVRQLHDEFPHVSYDFTAKIEHLLQHRELLPEFSDTGCVFVVSAVESLNDEILVKLGKGHTKADIEQTFVRMREAGLTLRPSLIPFTPWTTLDDYRELVDLADAVDIDLVQLSIRMLVPKNAPLDATAEWTSPLDGLQKQVAQIVESGGTLDDIRAAAGLPPRKGPPPERPIPARLTEPWFC